MIEYFYILAMHDYAKGKSTDKQKYFKCWCSDMDEVLRSNGVDRWKLLDFLTK